MNSQVSMVGAEDIITKPKRIEPGDIILIRNVQFDNKHLAKVLIEKEEDIEKKEIRKILLLAVLDNNKAYRICLKRGQSTYVGDALRTEDNTRLVIEGVCNISIAIKDIIK